MATIDIEHGAASRVAWYNDPRIRGLIYQALLVAVVAFLLYEAISNAAENLRRANIASGFGFLNATAGFSINQKLIEYSETSTYGRAFLVGLLNTLIVAAIGILLATILGFIIGIARLSRNFIINRMAYVYVEVVRNLPLLLQLLFWYNAVLTPLPAPRNSIELPGGIFLNNRGIVMPTPVLESAMAIVAAVILAGVVAAFAYRSWARRRQLETGMQYPVFRVALLLVIGLPALALVLTGFPISFEVPELRGFNFAGGTPIYPEFFALLIGLVTYTAAFIAEIVRAGILAVSHGQTEAGAALGFRQGKILRLIVIPQAMRVIIPPLTSQYLNLTKNSSLAVAIGYPDLVQVFAGTVLNQTGQAVEVILITMGVYLTISLVTSAFMNWYNRRVALTER